MSWSMWFAMESRNVRRLRDGWSAWTLAGLMIATVAACSGGSSGAGGPFTVLDASIDGIGELPIQLVPLNGDVVVRLSAAIDPDTVTSQTFRILRGPNFVETAGGEVVVEGSQIRFRPDLPARGDLGDGGLLPASDYRVWLRGLPDLNVIRSRGGRPLLTTTTFEFSTRSSEPLYFDTVPGAPEVLAVLIDLDGDGDFTGDGDPSTPEPEEFFEGETFFDPFLPFVDRVPVGSVSMPPPHAPQRIGILFSEPLDPRTVFRDADFDRVLDRVFLADVTNDYECDEPFPGDRCPRPLLMDVDYDPQFACAPVCRSLVTLEARHALTPRALHRLTLSIGLRDLVGTPFSRTFFASFETGEPTGLVDAFVESFDTTVRRAPITTALWNPLDRQFLRGGIGFGGDGSDGPFLGTVVDTTGNEGIFNFSEFNVVQGVDVIGDKPAVIRVRGDMRLGSTVHLRASGEDGSPGRLGSVFPVAGGAGALGGPSGGTASRNGHETERGDPGESPVEDGAGLGGFSGDGPGGGGGAGHRTLGETGYPGEGESGGDRGRNYGDAAAIELNYGSGGGAGGNSLTSSGGGGGGAGGIVTLEASGAVFLDIRNPAARISVNGGRGGLGAIDRDGKMSSGGGGGGSGGTLLMRARTFQMSHVFARGGNGGGVGPRAGKGGNGSPGRIRVESVDTSFRCSQCDPTPIFESMSQDRLGVSFGRSRFLRTNAPPGSVVRYSFDGITGVKPFESRVLFDAEDIVVLDEDGNRVGSADELPEGVTIDVWFRAAVDDPERPGEPLAGTLTEWTADIESLDGFPMIQWEVRFVVPGPYDLNPANDPGMPGIDDLRVHFRIEE